MDPGAYCDPNTQVWHARGGGDEATGSGMTVLTSGPRPSPPAQNMAGGEAHHWLAWGSGTRDQRTPLPRPGQLQRAPRDLGPGGGKGDSGTFPLPHRWGNQGTRQRSVCLGPRGFGDLQRKLLRSRICRLQRGAGLCPEKAELPREKAAPPGGQD